MSHSMSRRNVLKLAAAGLGATMGLGGTRLASAGPTPETPKLLVLWFNGGWSQIFSDAGPLANKQFSVTDSNIFAPSPGCGFLADESFKELPAFALQRMASVGMNHMSTNHERATSLVLEAPNGLHYPKTLATAMGGSGPLKAAEICHEGAQPTHREHVETVRNIDGAMAALAGVLVGGPNRALAERGMVAARAMSQSRLAKNPFRLGPMREGYDVSVASLGQTLPAFDPVAIQNAYPAGPWRR